MAACGRLAHVSIVTIVGVVRMAMAKICSINPRITSRGVCCLAVRIHPCYKSTAKYSVKRKVHDNNLMNIPS
jgi:hypothetical protein